MSIIRFCSVEDCETQCPPGLKMCKKHYTRTLRHGSPHIVITQRDTRRFGTDHHGWTNQPTYETAHSRIRRERGRACQYRCIGCGGPAQHWSYGYRTQNPFTDPERGQYSGDPRDYDPRCVPCHSAFDIAQRPIVPAGPDETRCQFDHCIRAAHIGLYCRTHHTQLRQVGDVGRKTPDLARERVESLVDLGWSLRAIERASGVSRERLTWLRRHEMHYVLADTEQRLLAIPLVPYRRAS